MSAHELGTAERCRLTTARNSSKHDRSVPRCAISGFLTAAIPPFGHVNIPTLTIMSRVHRGHAGTLHDAWHGRTKSSKAQFATYLQRPPDTLSSNEMAASLHSSMGRCFAALSVDSASIRSCNRDNAIMRHPTWRRNTDTTQRHLRSSCRRQEL